ncbi:Protein FAR1-RELATED SEQUENCE 5 [Abeliophyllum distichum]|uniref:Protein FAR1-RELATED SEQUENCE 5 n=1 Tax=Abeliophyllum distichum TaxID=126358 RepID=A0ABD1TJI8_9LAMI
MEVERADNVFVPQVTEGKTDETYQKTQKYAVVRTGERNRGKTRTGCNARLAVVKQQTGQLWVVNKFVEEHNHALTTPSRVHLLRSHRHVSATKKALTQQFAEANIPTCQQIRLLELDSGGPSSVGCVERDLRNHERNIREEQRGHDAETLIEYFTFEKEKSPNFYFDYEVDSENKFVRCIWADSESRRSYSCFGDAVVFDTTYNTNKYSMIFAPFVGVNHHGQTIVFACGLLSDESTESFVWLFSKFLEAMPRQAPQIIITDQDAAIAKAISMVMPFTFHRYCLWHILNKFSEKINVMVFNDEYHMLVNVIKNSESPDEFEEHWAAIMENREFAENEWLCSMYVICSRWIPSYVNHIFSAGMSSSQRSESGHSFFKSCRSFEFNGYPCRHMISCLRKKQVLLLPEKYIVGRWTKNAKINSCNYRDTGLSTNESSSTSLMGRHGLLAHKASFIVDEGALILMGEFESLHLRVKEIDDGGNIGSMRHNTTNRTDSFPIHDPSAVRAKGPTTDMDTQGEDSNVGTQYDGRDDGTFPSQASSHYDVVNWFILHM